LYVEAQVLFHLNQCGVFSVLGNGGAQKSTELAQQLGLDASVLQACLEYVAGMDEILACDEHGAFFLTPSGQAVLERFGRETAEGLAINLFDVRVGGYGPVWTALGGMLRGEASYGAEVRRAGHFAAQGVFKIGKRMAPGLATILADLPVQSEVELGVTTGLSQGMAARGQMRHRIGVDRSKEALAEAAARAGDAPISWVCGDFIADPESLLAEAVQGTTVFYSVHLHEFLALGRAQVIRWLRSLGRAFSGSYLVALEQPVLDQEAEGEVLRLYSSSNRFIHHLIGNGRILSADDWSALFREAGCRVNAVQELGYLGYHAWVVQLGEEG
jgi:hypothetical protein